MHALLSDAKYGFIGFINAKDKEFVAAFDDAMRGVGYKSNGIQPYVCLGKYKIEYSKTGLKTKKYVARFYFRDEGLALRLYFTNIDKHRAYLENAPLFIKEPFINGEGRCKHCYLNGGGIGKGGKCSFHKAYTLDGVLYEKCAGESFYFHTLTAEAIPQYVALLTAFYPGKHKAKH